MPRNLLKITTIILCLLLLLIFHDQVLEGAGLAVGLIWLFLQ